MTNQLLTSDHDVMRIEENERMVASLNVPNLPHVSSRPQARKAASPLEPTRRSSRQQKQREMVQNQLKEQEASELHQLKAGEIVDKKRNYDREQQIQQAEILAAAKQQQKLKRKQQQEVKAQEGARKKERAAQWKAEQIEKRRAHGRQVKLDMDVTKRKQTQLEAQQKVIRERRSAWRKECDLSPEKIARRNANIQKFIQEELDKQAQHAREQKQREREEARQRAEAGVVPQDTVRLKEDKDGAETWSELAHMTARFEDFEYEVML